MKISGLHMAYERKVTYGAELNVVQDKTWYDGGVICTNSSQQEDLGFE